MNFSCKKCGNCCRNIKHIPALHDFDRGDGVCVHLQGNLCEIYASRPLICNVEKMYSTFFKDTMTPEEFIALNLEACRKLSSIH
ncbi:MAG: YkgJ family cysteine cluster protein [Synergistaceae bacterium]|nr:YkgJ family cysteine cluster protein [Synergistaceae bacterium]